MEAFAMAGHTKWEKIRRSPPEVVEEHRRWAPAAANGAGLAELRALVGKTQAQVGEAMGVSQVEVGRVEKRPDLQVSTIRRYLAALGGELDVFARFGEKLVPLRLPEAGQVKAKAAAASRVASRSKK